MNLWLLLMKGWQEPEMSFKEIKVRFFPYVYSRLNSALRITGAFFQSAYIQYIYKDYIYKEKAVYKHKNSSSSGEYKRSLEENDSFKDEDYIYRFAGAPQHWL